MSSFWDYERSNNLLLISLQQNEEFKDIIQFVIQNEASILAPQGVTLENIKITRDFIETHVIITNPLNPTQWVSMNGILGVFSPKGEHIHVISSALQRESATFNPLVDLRTVFETERYLFPLKEEDQLTICPSTRFRAFSIEKSTNFLHILRKGQVNLEGKTLVTLTLISEPLCYDDCDWNPRKTNDNVHTTPQKSKEKEKEDSSASISTKTGGHLKPKGLRDFLTTFGSTSNNSPLFPESSEMSDNQEKKTTGQATAVSKTNLFYQKLKHQSAVEIVKSLKNFLNSASQQPLESMEAQASKILTYISSLEHTILEHPLWRDANDDEIDAVGEGLEKYVLTKLYPNVFQQHASDEEDTFLAKRIMQLQFITAEHLDIKPQLVNEASFVLACNELRKMNDYKAPRDKMICILNCCKVIFNLLNKATPNSTPGADEFLPLLIYIVLRANPKYLSTNIRYISNFRNPNKMISETGYYFTHLISATHFLKTLDSSCLSIDPDEFNRNMESGMANANLMEKSEPEPIPERRESLSRQQSFMDLISWERDASPNFSTMSNLPSVELSETSYPFVNCNVEDLKVGDLPTLFNQYKKLVEENQRLRSLLKDSLPNK